MTEREDGRLTELEFPSIWIESGNNAIPGNLQLVSILIMVWYQVPEIY